LHRSSSIASRWPPVSSASRLTVSHGRTPVDPEGTGECKEREEARNHCESKADSAHSAAPSPANGRLRRSRPCYLSLRRYGTTGNAVTLTGHPRAPVPSLPDASAPPEPRYILPRRALAVARLLKPARQAFWSVACRYVRPGGQSRGNWRTTPISRPRSSMRSAYAWGRSRSARAASRVLRPPRPRSPACRRTAPGRAVVSTGSPRMRGWGATRCARR